MVWTNKGNQIFKPPKFYIGCGGGSGGGGGRGGTRLIIKFTDFRPTFYRKEFTPAKFYIEGKRMRLIIEFTDLIEQRRIRPTLNRKEFMRVAPHLKTHSID